MQAGKGHVIAWRDILPSALDCANGNTGNKVLLQERIQAHDRQGGNHHGGIFQTIADDLNITGGTSHVADVALNQDLAQDHLQSTENDPECTAMPGTSCSTAQRRRTAP